MKKKILIIVPSILIITFMAYAGFIFFNVEKVKKTLLEIIAAEETVIVGELSTSYSLLTQTIEFNNIKFLNKSSDEKSSNYGFVKKAKIHYDIRKKNTVLVEIPQFSIFKNNKEILIIRKLNNKKIEATLTRNNDITLKNLFNSFEITDHNQKVIALVKYDNPSSSLRLSANSKSVKMTFNTSNVKIFQGKNTEIATIDSISKNSFFQTKNRYEASLLLNIKGFKLSKSLNQMIKQDPMAQMYKSLLYQNNTDFEVINIKTKHDFAIDIDFNLSKDLKSNIINLKNLEYGNESFKTFFNMKLNFTYPPNEKSAIDFNLNIQNIEKILELNLIANFLKEKIPEIPNYNKEMPVDESHKIINEEIIAAIKIFAAKNPLSKDNLVAFLGKANILAKNGTINGVSPEEAKIEMLMYLQAKLLERKVIIEPKKEKAVPKPTAKTITSDIVKEKKPKNPKQTKFYNGELHIEIVD